MSDHDHTDEAGKPLNEAVIDLSDAADSSESEFQSLLDESIFEQEPPADNADTLSEPDMDALVSEDTLASGAEEPGLASAPQVDEVTDTPASEAMVADQETIPADVPEVIVQMEEEDDDPVAAETSPADEDEAAISDLSQDHPQPDFDAPTEEEDDFSADESDGMTVSDDSQGEDEMAFAPPSEEETDFEPISAAGDMDADEDSESGDDYGSDTSWLDDDEDESVETSSGYGGGDEPPEAPEKKGGSKLPLLLVLLAVVAGAAFYLTNEAPEQPRAPVMEPKPAPVPVPAQPDQQATQPSDTSMAQTSQEAAPQATEPQAATPSEPSASTEKGAEEPTAVKTDNKMAMITPQTPENGAAAMSKSKKMEPAAPKEVKATAAPAAPKAMAAQGQYTLQGGVFVSQANLKKMENRVRKLGFDPQVTDKRKLLPMTRLRVGEFPAGIAPAKLQQVKKIAPHGAFALRKGDQVVIYVGSYFYAPSAHRAAKLLASKGLPVQEVPAKAVIPVHILRFGAFPDRASAEAKQAELKKAGMNAIVKKTGTASTH